MSAMDPQMEKLLVLQEREQRKMRLDRELAAWPTEMKSLESKKAEIRAGAERKKQEAQQTEVERKKLELEAESHRSKVARYKIQQFETRKNEEFQALGTEIQREEKEIVDLVRARAERLRRTQFKFKLKLKKAIGGLLGILNPAGDGRSEMGDGVRLEHTSLLLASHGTPLHTGSEKGKEDSAGIARPANLAGIRVGIPAGSVGGREQQGGEQGLGGRRSPFLPAKSGGVA